MGDRRRSGPATRSSEISPEADVDKEAAEAAAVVGWPPCPIAPDWIRWTNAESILLDDAVALSLGAEPVWDQLILEPGDCLGPLSQTVMWIEQPGQPREPDRPAAMREHSTIRVSRRTWARTGDLTRWHHPAHTTEEGRTRLGRMRDYLGTEFLPNAARVDGRPAITLRSLAALGNRLHWIMPPGLTALPGQQPQDGASTSVGASLTNTARDDAATNAPRATKSRSKLTESQWEELHAQRRSGTSDVDLARQFGTSRKAIHARFGKRSADVKEPRHEATHWASPITSR